MNRDYEKWIPHIGKQHFQKYLGSKSHTNHIANQFMGSALGAGKTVVNLSIPKNDVLWRFFLHHISFLYIYDNILIFILFWGTPLHLEIRMENYNLCETVNNFTMSDEQNIITINVLFVFCINYCWNHSFFLLLLIFHAVSNVIPIQWATFIAIVKGDILF